MKWEKSSNCQREGFAACSTYTHTHTRKSGEHSPRQISKSFHPKASWSYNSNATEPQWRLHSMSCWERKVGDEIYFPNDLRSCFFHCGRRDSRYTGLLVWELFLCAATENRASSLIILLPDSVAVPGVLIGCCFTVYQILFSLLFFYSFIATRRLFFCFSSKYV